MDKAAWDLCLGIFVLCLSLIIWRATGSFLGWAGLFVPGSVYICRGLYGTFAA
jgi:hypothetical protein